MINFQIRALFKKEIIQTLRDKRMVILLMIAPIIQVLIFGYAATMDIHNTSTVVCDHDQSAYSRKFIRSFSQGGYFALNGIYHNEKKAYNFFLKKRQSILLIIPPRFASHILSGKGTEIQVIIDGSDTTTAGVAGSYLGAAVRRFNTQLNPNPKQDPILIHTRFFYNPNLKSSTFLIPGVVVMILTLVTMLLTAMAITREREIGTLEQIIVSPIKPSELILGKTLPFLMFGCIDATLIITAGSVFFNIPILGSLPLLMLSALLYVFVCIGSGITISTFSHTQQQAMLSFFFFMFPAIILSGFMFPINNMPPLFRFITLANPMRYFLECIRGIMLKGNSIDVLYPWLLALMGFGMMTIGLGIFRLRKKWL